MLQKKVRSLLKPQNRQHKELKKAESQFFGNRGIAIKIFLSVLIATTVLFLTACGSSEASLVGDKANYIASYIEGNVASVDEIYCYYDNNSRSKVTLNIKFYSSPEFFGDAVADAVEMAREVLKETGKKLGRARFRINSQEDGYVAWETKNLKTGKLEIRAGDVDSTRYFVSLRSLQKRFSPDNSAEFDEWRSIAQERYTTTSTTQDVNKQQLAEIANQIKAYKIPGIDSLNIYGLYFPKGSDKVCLALGLDQNQYRDKTILEKSIPEFLATCKSLLDEKGFSVGELKIKYYFPSDSKPWNISWKGDFNQKGKGVLGYWDVSGSETKPPDEEVSLTLDELIDFITEKGSYVVTTTAQAS